MKQRLFHLALSILRLILLVFVVVHGSAQSVTPPESTLFATVAEEAFSTYQMQADGDLWPSCWADDDNLYAANGDGTAFTGAASRFDMAVSRIAGMPPNLTGATVATNVGANWSGVNYNRKPTGMACVNGTLYLAYQNLNLQNFNDAPAASIASSSDHGVTWNWDATAPMFGVPGTPADPKAYKFTTIFFLDYGKNYSDSQDSYVYAYGLDNNWREQQVLFLARVPALSVTDRSTWEFYSGNNLSGSPTWTADITQKLPVLVDDRRLYPTMFATDCPADNPVIAQGGVVYDAPLQRYIFSSWSCATHELYEAPQPWGPWSHFLSHDFGPLRLTQNRGQYGTTIPSKFISADGLTLNLQSNVCCGGDSYTFSLRKIYLAPAASQTPANTPSTTNLATASGTRAISKSTHFGELCAAGCADMIATGATGLSEDDWDEESKTTDWWGYVWPQPYNLNQVVYTTGTIFSNGGWFSNNLRVQVRQNFQWIDVSGGTVTPAYPYSSLAGAQADYTFNFADTWGDGVRIIGTPGGTSYFTSIGRLEVYDAGAPPAGSAGIDLTVTSATMNLTAGGTSSVTVNIAPVNGFAQQVSFSCSGLPAKAQCSFLPQTVTLDGKTTASTSVSISTTASSQARNVDPYFHTGGGAMLAWCLLFLGRKSRREISTRLILLSVVVSLLCFSTSSCGGGGSAPTVSIPGTPAGTYPITITGSSGTGATAVVGTASLSLTVQ